MSDASRGPFRLETTPLGVGGELGRLILKEERRAGPPPRAFATFQIFGDTLVPSSWTRYFRRSPSHKHMKGGMPTAFKQEAAQSLAGVAAQRTLRDRGMEPLDTRPGGKRSARCAFALSVGALDLSSRPNLAEWLASENVVARVLCFWDDSCGDRVPAIDADPCASFARSGITIEIEEYPRPFTISDGERDYPAWV